MCRHPSPFYSQYFVYFKGLKMNFQQAQFAYQNLEQESIDLERVKSAGSFFTGQIVAGEIGGLSLTGIVKAIFIEEFSGIIDSIEVGIPREGVRIFNPSELKTFFKGN